MKKGVLLAEKQKNKTTIKKSNPTASVVNTEEQIEPSKDIKAIDLIIPPQNVKDFSRKRRDKNGRFSKSGENGIDDNDTENEARDRRLIDALEGGLEMVANASVEQVDPTIDAIKELGGVIDLGKKVGVPIGRGFGKLFSQNDNKDDKSRRWRDRFFSFFKKSTKDNEKKQVKVIDWLKNLWEKDEGGSFLGGLLKTILTIFAGLFLSPFVKSRNIFYKLLILFCISSH
ncbi:hypothetical protein A1D23_09225 [Chelonobacter oris]|uniref:hypothetical protein n=1 Tax=Chelonobacter oris TaxID=505317 RepID=UPI002448C0F8|nr:hypothetical protein [Chelonobacter oris]MDH3000359.1 hypothetical protein [Chelonobacter oris]